MGILAEPAGSNRQVIPAVPSSAPGRRRYQGFKLTLTLMIPAQESYGE
jgi:hypothetical protein